MQTTAGNRRGHQETDVLQTSVTTCVGLLAHVDAGKTTLAEAILYLTGSIRRLGRVDHGDAFLDNFHLERDRGITIFSKQAGYMFEDRSFTLLDTPGHVDFSAEMERTLQILDCAVLVISAADGIQGHTLTLWKLLERYQIPTFLFFNKMDIPGTDRETVLSEARRCLSDNCLAFPCGDTPDVSGRTEFYEEAAMQDETVLNHYLSDGKVSRRDLRRLVKERKIFLCFFGAALREEGVKDLLKGLADYTAPPLYSADFGARVYKISRDSQGNRLTHMRITGGRLHVKNVISEGERPDCSSQGVWQEKADQIRLYSGASFTAVEEARAGSVCTVTGLTKTYAGEGLGSEAEKPEVPSSFQPVLTYRVELPAGCDTHRMLQDLRQLEEEEPELSILWDEANAEIHVQVMGQVQTEVFQNLVSERFGVNVDLGDESIVYKETIARTVEGVGHFEPLRHYAEVHLLLEPGERGSGLAFSSSCSEDVLDRNWQRLILTHLAEKRHVGVLMGAELTDVKITLVAGKAHIKHTEGGDFRQATYRAVRQGLMKTESILLEPVYEFTLEVPSEVIGRAMTDIRRMCGTFEPPLATGEMSVLTGQVPASELGDYGREVTAYSRGRGTLSISLKGYEPCHNAEEVVAKSGYLAEADTENPSYSIFCSHGAGFVVPWDEVDGMAHVSSGLNPAQDEEPETYAYDKDASSAGERYEEMRATDKELEEIFERTYGPAKPRLQLGKDLGDRVPSSRFSEETARRNRRQEPVRKTPQEVLLVDGYNVIFSWEELDRLSKTNLEAARSTLQDILCDYQGYRGMRLILVFDAYKVEGALEESFRYHNIEVVYTREGEKADQYIERTAHELGGTLPVTVATSDNLEQVTVLAQGARRMSSRELLAEVNAAREEIRREHIGRGTGCKNLLIHQASDEMAEWMEDVRLGRRSVEDVPPDSKKNGH